MKKWMKGWGRRLAVLAAVFFSFPLHAAPGGTWTDIDHLNAYPTPQNLMAELDGSRVKLSWDGIRWPADGFPEVVDGLEVPTNFCYDVWCRAKTTGTGDWGDWWYRTGRERLDANGAFVSRWEIMDDVETGKTYQYKIRCRAYVEPDNPQDLENPTRDCFYSEYSETVTAYRTLDKLEIALSSTPVPSLSGMATIDLSYKYTSTRADEGEDPLYFTFKAIAVPEYPDGTTPEAPVEGGKPYVRRYGTPLAVNELQVIPDADDELPKSVDSTNFTLTASSTGATGTMSWLAAWDLENYRHTNVTIWVQGWAKPETEGGNSRCVLDEAIGDLTLDTRTVTGTPQPDQDNILLSWPAIPGAAKYQVWRAGYKESDPYERIEEFSPMGKAVTVSFTDMSVFPGTRYKYKVVALDADGNELDSSAPNPVYTYSRLDVFSRADESLYDVQPQTPWNGKVDLVVRYYSARDVRVDGTPHFRLIAENYESGETLTVKTLTRADGEAINADDFTLKDEQNLEQRLVWDAGADLGETLVERLRLTVECVRVEPYWEGDPVTAWTGSSAKYKENVRLDTRNPRIRKLGQGTHAYVDLDWFPGATKADLYCNGTLIHTTTDIYTRTKKLGNDELNIWGTNELKVVTDTGVTWTGGIAYPAFGFTVTEGNEDGITLTWNTIDDEAVGGYQVRRRVRGSTGDFETVATLGVDETTWTDTTADEAGAYEYTVVPRRTWEADIGPVPAAKRGYRALDKIEIVQARQLYPWTTQVALDVSFASGRDEATDGAVTYKLEAELADGTAIPVTQDNLRLETVGGFKLDPNDIPFGSPSLASGATTRLWWNAPADLGQVQLPSSVLSGIVLRIVPTLAADAPEGAVAAPAPSVKDDLTVDLRTVRPVTVGEKIPIVWEWMRTDTRDETKDRTVISFQLQDGREDDVLTPDQKTGEGEFEVTDDMWTSFRLIKREKNDGADDANVIELTSEVRFQLPAEPAKNVTATRGMTADEKAAVTVTWDPVPFAERYYLTMTRVNEGGATYQNFVTVYDTQHVDRDAPEVGFVRYEVQAVYQNRVNGDPALAVGWRSIDKAELTNVSTRRPWNGTVDLDLTYRTVRDKYGKVMDGAAALPGKTVTVAVTTADGAKFKVDSLIRETLSSSAGIIRREPVTNGAFTLGANDRIVWNAQADAPRMREPGAVLTVTLAGDEYSEAIVFEKTFDLDTRTGVIDLPFGSVNVPIPWSTRWAKPEVKDGYLGANENDAWWKQTAVLTDVTDDANHVELLRTEAKLGEGTVCTWTPKVWGVNSLTLKLSPVSGLNETTEYAAVFKMPDFAFRVEAANADGVTLKWNALDGAASYDICRRKAGTSDAFEEITNVTDVTSWTDTSIATVVGDFEYVVVPRTAGGSAGPALAPVSGTRGAPQTPQNVVASTNDTNAVTVTWDAVPNVAHYRLDITTYGERGTSKTDSQEVSDGTQYVDTVAPAVGLVRYTVTAVYANGMEGATTAPVVGWRALDAVEWKKLSTRWPWNGTVDVDFVYQTGRRHYAMATGAADDLPERIVTVAAKTAEGVDLPVQTLTLETLAEDIIGRQKVTNGAFTLGSADRIIWDAPADAPVGMYEPGVTLTVTIAGDEYSEPIMFEKTFDLDTRIGDIELPFGAEDVQIPWSTRWAKPDTAVLGSTDNWWKQTAVLADITDNANPVEILRTEAKLGEGMTNSWTPKDWRNTLTLKLSPYSGDNETTEYAAVFKLPDFDFSATTDNEDGVTLTWDDLDGAASYEIRRRKAGETDYVTITNVTDATTWTDDSVDTVVGDFEYVVVPKSATGKTLPVQPSVPGTRGAPQEVQNVTASQGETNAVIVAWDAVPNASAYEVTVENWDVAINRTERTVTVNGNQFIDDQLPQPGLGRYTVTAVYPNGMKGAASASAIGYAVLDTMKILGVSTRWPWNGTVDLDVEYKTVRTRFRELFGLADLPYPTNVTLAAQTADGTPITVATLGKEATIDPGNYTVNRAAVPNGTQDPNGTMIFMGSGWTRLVWDADADAQNNLNATNATLTLTASDDYFRTTDRCTVDLNTTKPVAIPLPEDSEANDRAIAFPWAVRWADEATRSLNMQDGSDVEIVTVTRYGTVTNVVETQTQLADEGGVFTWRPGDSYGVLIVEGSFTNRATGASALYRAKFLRSVPTPVRVERMPGQNALDIWWTGSADCTYYQIMRREVYADGTRSAWRNMAPVSTYGDDHPHAGLGRYIDISVVGGKTYEYTACPFYPDPDTHDYLMADPVVWAAGSAAVVVQLDALGPYLADGGTVTTQFVGGAYGELPTATRAGYKLVGWALGVTNGAPEVVAGTPLLMNANHTLYAKWAVDPAASPDVDADGNSIFNAEVLPGGKTMRILGLSDPAQKVTNLVLPDAIDGYLVTEIADYAFANSTCGLTALTLPAYCTRIGTRAFSGVKTLTRLTFTPVRNWMDPSQAGEIVIGRYAFAATGLTSVFLPVEVVQIGDYAFADCRKLTEVMVLGRPAVGVRPFRRAGIDAGVKPTIRLNKDLENDAAYLDRITQDFGNDVFEVRTDAVVTGLSLGALAVPAPGAVRLSVGVERASTWGEVDVSRLRVVYRAQLGDAPTDLVPRAVTHEADGSLTVEVDAPEGPSGFFRVKLVK